MKAEAADGNSAEFPISRGIFSPGGREEVSRTESANPGIRTEVASVESDVNAASMILVIDDDVDLASLIVRALRRAGYRAETAADGRKGCALAHTLQPDLVLTDIWMDEQDGLETIMRLRRELPQTKIMAMSGRPEMGGMKLLPLALQLGAVQLLPKPFEQQRLLEAIKVALETA
jgi:CheY-like chemotaxis protein